MMMMMITTWIFGDGKTGLGQKWRDEEGGESDGAHLGRVESKLTRAATQHPSRVAVFTCTEGENGDSFVPARLPALTKRDAASQDSRLTKEIPRATLPRQHTEQGVGTVPKDNQA
ncbi:unnamed protein product [Lampetra fluviatilis]